MIFLANRRVHKLETPNISCFTVSGFFILLVYLCSFRKNAFQLLGVLKPLEAFESLNVYYQRGLNK